MHGRRGYASDTSTHACAKFADFRYVQLIGLTMDDGRRQKPSRDVRRLLPATYQALQLAAEVDHASFERLHDLELREHIRILDRDEFERMSGLHSGEDDVLDFLVGRVRPAGQRDPILAAGRFDQACLDILVLDRIDVPGGETVIFPARERDDQRIRIDRRRQMGEVFEAGPNAFRRIRPARALIVAD